METEGRVLLDPNHYSLFWAEKETKTYSFLTNPKLLSTPSPTLDLTTEAEAFSSAFSSAFSTLSVQLPRHNEAHVLY